MKSNVLITKLSRLVETGGAAEGGASAALAYADAVREANKRLEKVVAAADSRVIGDAIRLLSEDPPLLEEVSTLDFFQLEDWKSLCVMNDWETPPEIDKRLLERAIEIGEAKDAIAPFLSMYKKAVRVNDTRLVVKSLRRLVDLDKTQNWRSNLVQAEKRLQEQLIGEFAEAQKAQNIEECERMAQELLSGVWAEPVTLRGIEKVKAFKDERDAQKRAAAGKENIEILRKCLNEKWSRKQAMSLVQAMDSLVSKGLKVSEDEKAVVEDCRERCAKEVAQEEADIRWREINELLHAAIQRENVEEIREVLSAPEFLDRDPENDMLSAAQTVIDHADAMRRRKMTKVAASVCLIVLAIVAGSGWWLKQKMFTSRCEDEALALAYLDEQSKEKPAYAIDAMRKRLAALKESENDKAVYEYPKVIQFEERLAAIVRANEARTNQIAQVLQELESAMAADWKDTGVGLYTNKVAAVEKTLLKEDAAFNKRLLAIKNSRLDYEQKTEEANTAKAVAFEKSLLSHLKTVTERLMQGYKDSALAKDEEACKESLKEWREYHSQYALDKETELNEAEKKFNEAVSAQNGYRETLDKFNKASSVQKTLELRKELISDYGNFAEAKNLKPLAMTDDEIKSIVDGTSAAQEEFAASLRHGVSDGDFRAFIENNVLPFENTPEYFSLYGIAVKDSGGHFAYSKGRPTIETTSYDNKVTVRKDGHGLLCFAKQSVESEIKGHKQVGKPELLPISQEIKTVVEAAQRENVTEAKFETEILRMIDAHIQAAHEKNFVDAEERQTNEKLPRKGWFSPYGRVQLVSLYIRWLKDDLKLMPAQLQTEKWIRDLEASANVVGVDGIPDELTWACLWDERVKARNLHCARLLANVPSDWVNRYRRAKLQSADISSIAAWKVMYAGQVKFDPADPLWKKNPDTIIPSVGSTNNDHPLYVLRKVHGKPVLVRAFEQGKASPWRKCANVDYILGEPLFHVLAGGKFIDAQDELAAIANRNKMNLEHLMKTIPLYGNGGK